jgi:hypothetical protein
LIVLTVLWSVRAWDNLLALEKVEAFCSWGAMRARREDSWVWREVVDEEEDSGGIKNAD